MRVYGSALGPQEGACRRVRIGGSRRAISGSTLWQWAATGVDTTPSFILAEYDLDPKGLRGCYEGLKSPKKVRTIDKISKAPIQISGVVTRG